MVKVNHSVKWISHRGYCAEAVENTRQSFLHAVQSGFKFLETDFQLTKDRHIILAHDEDLKRLCGRNEKISELNRNELKRVEFENGLGSFFFLDELLDEFRDFGWTFDIKKPFATEIISEFNRLIIDRELKNWVAEQVVFLTWDEAHEKMLKHCFSFAKFYARSSECRRAGVALMGNMPWLSGIQSHKVYSLPSKYLGIDLFRRNFVQAYHKRGTRTLAFLPESKELTQKAIDAGFDEILTNGLII